MTQRMQGRSLLDAAAPDREVFSETFSCQVIQPAECAGCSARAVVKWPYKYIVFNNTGKKQWFNVDADPDETRELAGAAVAGLGQLSEGLGVWIKTIPAQARQQKKMTPEEMRRLKSLGYVGGN